MPKSYATTNKLALSGPTVYGSDAVTSATRSRPSVPPSACAAARSASRSAIPNAPGIAPADHTRIFERFVRIGPSTGGGLGLPIARWIAEAHGGALTLEHSEPGRTTFAVRIPTAPVIARSSTP